MFSGIHYRDGSVRESMGFGICTVLKCNSKTSDMCDSHVSSNQKLLNMSLHKIIDFLTFTIFHLIKTIR